MNRIYRTLGLLLVSFLLFQCQKSLSYIGDPDPEIPVIAAPQPDPVTATIQGNIVDENGAAAGVNITVGTKTAITNATGYFRIDGASLDKNTSMVTAEKQGYFKGYRVFSATSGTNQVFIKLVKKDLAGTIAAVSGGVASLTNGAKISLPANGVVVASSGSAYTGDVKVYAAYIDPTATDIAQRVPGSFMANDKNGSRVTLSSFGMLAVELEGSGGEKLQVKTGLMATLTTPIPATALSSAPATIALWYVDEQTGLWKEEGTATKQGNNYVGDVKHFSFWNCDYPMNAVSLSLTLQNADSLPLSYVTVRITRTSIDTGTASSTYGFTDSSGVVKGLVPSDNPLLLEVLDPCGMVVFSQNISALTQDTDLGVITVTNSTSSLLTYTGKLLDCNGAPVTNGYAIINIDNVVRYAATNALGQFTTTFFTCSGTPATSQVIGVDKNSQQQSTSTTVTVTAPNTNAGSITACGILSEFINYTLDGIDYSLTKNANDSSLVAYRIGSTLFMTARDSTNYFYLSANASATGTFPVSILDVQGYRNNILTQPFNITFTSFADTTGEFYEGSMSGAFTTDTLATVHNISTTFRVRRN